LPVAYFAAIFLHYTNIDYVLVIDIQFRIRINVYAANKNEYDTVVYRTRRAGKRQQFYELFWNRLRR
jgi:hypothetical protein